MKKLTILTVAMTLKAFGAENSAAIFHFDANAGQVAVDSSGYGNNGQLGSTMGADANDPTWTAGKFGSALHFDGLSQYVRVPSSASLAITGSLTLETWVKPESLNAASHGVIARWNDATSTTGRGYALVIDQGYARFDVSHTGLFGGNCSNPTPYQYSCDNSALVYSSFPIPTGRWTHIAAVFDSANKKIQLFLNGIPDTSIGTKSANIFDNGEPLLIGAADYAGHRSYYQGTIDEPRVWSRALSAAEILSSAQAGLRALLHFNTVTAGSPVMTPDSSGMGNDAEVHGPTAVANGKFGADLSWDGVNDFAFSGNNPTLNITGPITLEAWVNMNAFQPNPAGFAPIIAKWNDQIFGGVPTNARAYALAIMPDGAVRFDISHTGKFTCAVNQTSCADANSAYVKSSQKLQLHAWYHIAGTFDGTTMQVFVNGVPDTSVHTVHSNINQIGYPVAYGFAYEGTVPPLPGAGQFANGMIDEVKIWARGLSAPEIGFEAGAATAAELQLPLTLSQDGLSNKGGGNGAGAIGATDLKTDLKTAMVLEFLNPDAPGVSISSINGHVSNGNGASLLGWVTGNSGLDALMTGKTVNPPVLNMVINLSDKSKLNVSFEWQ